MENKVFSDQQRSSSEISSAIEGLSMVGKAENGDSKDDQDDNSLQIPTKHFLSLCNSLVLHVLDKIGPTMAVLRQDVHQNIQRLEMQHESNPLKYSNVVEMIKEEVAEGTARKGASCSKAFVWLTR
ncbi:hypothetical protein TIFTF001_021105 [Ficus carica]|uniref:Glycolipid transfer protein domain-containing protein n=1 Tax=Ficus carica TaxID=3494 RepID=A0AA88DAE9_FICCA|nr:hypothetical protein TIFTF001_021105 [Ficus carica]